eukprot:Gb_36572 [translate_table: standard]
MVMGSCMILHKPLIGIHQKTGNDNRLLFNSFNLKISTSVNLSAIRSRPHKPTTHCVAKAKHGSTSAAATASELPSRPLRIFISTGDVMGDMHGASLIEEILKQAEIDGKHVKVYALGGHRMKAAGAVLIGNNGGLSSIGIFEALPFVLPSLYLQTVVRHFVQKCPPDIVVLIDYPGVNIPFGKYIRKHFGCKIIYYIPPNEWLWTTIRTHSIVRISDLILSVYHGESLYYRKAGANVIDVGHPLIDNFNDMTRQEARVKLGVQEDDIVVALLPASREQELRHVWPLIASAAKYLSSVSDSLRRSIRFYIPLVLPKQIKALKESLHQYGLLQHVRFWPSNPTAGWQL